MGVDGISLFLVLLTTLLTPLSILASYSITDRPKEYLLFMLVLETGVIGVFAPPGSVPVLRFLGSHADSDVLPDRRLGRGTADLCGDEVFVYTVVGSLLMLVAIIAVYFLNGGTTVDIVEIPKSWRPRAAGIGTCAEAAAALVPAFALAFFIKVPLSRFIRGCRTRTSKRRPPVRSFWLALLKMGTYGLMRFNLPFFPEVSPGCGADCDDLAVIGIIYGALVAMVQPDMKKLVAYSSVSHLGFVVLGIFAFTEQGMQGALYQMLNHGIRPARCSLRRCVYERRHTRLIADYGGLATPMPHIRRSS